MGQPPRQHLDISITQFQPIVLLQVSWKPHKRRSFIFMTQNHVSQVPSPTFALSFPSLCFSLSARFSSSLNIQFLSSPLPSVCFPFLPASLLTILGVRTCHSIFGSHCKMTMKRSLFKISNNANTVTTENTLSMGPRGTAQATCPGIQPCLQLRLPRSWSPLLPPASLDFYTHTTCC